MRWTRRCCDVCTIESKKKIQETADTKIKSNDPTSDWGSDAGAGGGKQLHSIAGNTKSCARNCVRNIEMLLLASQRFEKYTYMLTEKVRHIDQVFCFTAKNTFLQLKLKLKLAWKPPSNFIQSIAKFIKKHKESSISYDTKINSEKTYIFCEVKWGLLR